MVIERAHTRGNIQRNRVWNMPMSAVGFGLLDVDRRRRCEGGIHNRVDVDDDVSVVGEGVGGWIKATCYQR